MTRAETISALRRHADDLRARGVVHLALFGSVARDQAKQTSDIDVLIDIAPNHPFSLTDLASLRLHLRDILGREAEVLVSEDLRPAFRDRIARDRVGVFLSGGFTNSRH